MYAIVRTDFGTERELLAADLINGPNILLDGMAAVVYRLMDAQGRLLYVGSTTAPRNRIRGHQRSQEWWPEVAIVRLVEYPTRKEANTAEAAAIRAESPRYNLAGKPGSGVSYRAYGGLSVVPT